MGDLRACPARMYEYACELRYDHDGDHRRGQVVWERLTPGTTAEIDQCTHWLVGAKVGIPQMYDLRCAREPHANGKHVCGSTDWNDSAGEYRD